MVSWAQPEPVYYLQPGNTSLMFLKVFLGISLVNLSEKCLWDWIWWNHLPGSISCGRAESHSEPFKTPAAARWLDWRTTWRDIKRWIKRTLVDWLINRTTQNSLSVRLNLDSTAQQVVETERWRCPCCPRQDQRLHGPDACGHCREALLPVHPCWGRGGNPAEPPGPWVAQHCRGTTGADTVWLVPTFIHLAKTSPYILNPDDQIYRKNTRYWSIQ